MVYKKFSKRNGKIYGPYVYHNRRVDGKVITSYHGKDKGRLDFSSKVFIFVASFVVLNIALFGFFFPAASLAPEITHKEIYSPGEPLEGTLVLVGEKIPSDATVSVRVGSDTGKNYRLHDLADLHSSFRQVGEDSFYLEGESTPLSTYTISPIILVDFYVTVLKSPESDAGGSGEDGSGDGGSGEDGSGGGSSLECSSSLDCPQGFSCAGGRCLPASVPTCFLQGTLIETIYGSKAIETIKVGDYVLSYDEVNDEKKYSRVTETFKHVSAEYLVINEKMKVTSNHPVYSNEGWKDAGDLKVGDLLKGVGGEILVYSVERFFEEVDVYNLEVEDYHNYFAEGILVHNKVTELIPTPTLGEDSIKGDIGTGTDAIVPPPSERFVDRIIKSDDGGEKTIFSYAIKNFQIDDSNTKVVTLRVSANSPHVVEGLRGNIEIGLVPGSARLSNNPSVSVPDGVINIEYDSVRGVATISTEYTESVVRELQAVEIDLKKTNLRVPDKDAIVYVDLSDNLGRRISSGSFLVRVLTLREGFFLPTITDDGRSYGAVIGEPVQWIKSLEISRSAYEAGLSEESLFTEAKLPSTANVFSVRVEDESGNVISSGEGLFPREDSSSGSMQGSQSSSDVVSSVSPTDVSEDDKREDVDGTNSEPVSSQLVPSADGNLITGRVIEGEESLFITLEYFTPAPELNILERAILRGTEIFKVSVSGPEEPHYENVLAYLDFPNVVDSARRVKIFRTTFGVREPVSIEGFSVTSSGKISRVYFVVDRLSEQTYDIIIEASAAEHLDDRRIFVSDIFGEVAMKDDLWSEPIPGGHFVRVSFERPLDSSKDITLYARSNGTSEIDVYLSGGEEVVATFSEISEEGYYTVYLNSLVIGESYETFDLKVRGDSVEFDLIIDPTIDFLDSNSPALSVSPLGLEKFVVGWCEMFSVGEASVYARVYSTDGTEISPVIPVSLNVSNCMSYDKAVSVAGIDENSFVVSFAESVPGNLRVVSKIYSSNGEQISDEIISHSSTGRAGVDVASLGNSGFVVGYFRGNPGKIYFRTYSSNGEQISDEVFVSDVGSNSFAVSVSSFNEEEFVISWYDPQARRVYYRTYDLTGNPRSDKFAIEEDVGSMSFRLSVSALNSEKFVLAYVDSVRRELKFDIFPNNSSNSVVVDSLPFVAGSIAVDTARIDNSKFLVAWYNYNGSSANYGSVYNFAIYDLEKNIIVPKTNVASNPFWFGQSVAVAIASSQFSSRLRLCDRNFVYVFPTENSTSWKLYSVDGSESGVGCSNVSSFDLEFDFNTPQDGGRIFSGEFEVGLESDYAGNYYSFLDLDDSLTLWMRFENSVVEQSSNNNLISLNSLSFDDSCKWGSCALFEGGEGLIILNPRENLYLEEEGAYSWFGWINPSFSDSRIGIFGLSDSYNIFINEERKVTFESSGVEISSEYALGAGWNSVSVVYDAGNVKIYVGGVLSGEGEIVPEFNSNGVLFIGADSESDFFGKMDDVLFFRRAISSEEVLSLHDSLYTSYHNLFAELSAGEHKFVGRAVNDFGVETSTEERRLFLEEIPLDACGEIAVSNRVYYLERSLSSNEDCLVINGDGIIIDGRGHTISGDFSSNGISVAEGKEIKIKNMKIENFYSGIYFDSVSNSEVSEVEFDSNVRAGVEIHSSNDNTFSRNSVRNSQYGVYLGAGSQGNIFINNDLSGEDYSIFDVSGSSGNRLVYKNSFGQIKWNDESFLRDLTIREEIIFGRDVQIRNNFARVDESHFSSDGILSSAEVTLNNVGGKFVEPGVIRDGEKVCDFSTEPSCRNITSLDKKNVVFVVSSWSSYSIGEVGGKSNFPLLLEVHSRDAKIGEPVEFNLKITNLGEEDISAYSLIEIYDSGSNLVETIPIGQQPLQASSFVELTVLLQTADYDYGNYKASALVRKDDFKISEDTNFRLGTLFIDFSGYAGTFDEREGDFFVEVQSFWNDEIEDVYFEAKVLGYESLNFESQKVSLGPFGSTVLLSSFDSSEILDDRIEAEIILHYGEFTTKKIVLLERERSSFSYYLIILGLLALLLVVFQILNTIRYKNFFRRKN